MPDVVLIMSGGMDSTTLLYHLLNEGLEVKALGVDYGQRHGKELAFARATCEARDVDFQVADLVSLNHLLQGSALTTSSISVPEGHYAEESMKATVVPNRNMLLLSVATAWAVSLKAGAVAYAAHAGDHAIYPDCRRVFADALGVAIQLCDWHDVRLMRPFVDWTKADIAARGAHLGVEWSLTWSCYKGGELHCGKCGTCVERIEAFDLAGVPDPTAYEVRESIA